MLFRSRGGGEALRLEATIGRLDPGRPFGFAAKVQSVGAEVWFTGAANRGVAGFQLVGPIKVAAADTSKFLSHLGVTAAPLRGASSIEAKLTWADGRVTLSDLMFESSETRATGRVDLTESLRAGEVQLAVGRLDIEPWRDTVATLLGGADGRDISLILSAEAVGFRGALMRQARAEVRLLDRQVAIRQLSALAPGGTELTLFARVSSAGAVPTYEGEIDLASDNLRVALAWLGIEPPGIPPDRLRRAGGSLRASFDGRRLTVPSFDLKLDASRMLGSGNLILGDAPRFDIRVAVDRFALDPYLPLLGVALGAGAGGTLAAAVDLMAWRGIAMRDVDVEVEIADAVVDLRRLRIAEAGGAGIAATGRIGIEGVGSDLSFDLSTRRPAELLRLFGNGDAIGAADAPVTVAGRLHGPPTDLALSGAVVTPQGTGDRKSTRLNSSHVSESRMPSSA